MSLKQEIEIWVQALDYYDKNEFGEAIRTFRNIAETSKIWFNCGVIHATLGDHGDAVACYQEAIKLDQYLAVAYFQQGVSNFLVGDFEEALANFNDTLLYLRGNTCIDYDQLGLKFKLYSCEVLFNRGMCYMKLEQYKFGMQDFSFAVKEKMTPDHDVIDDAIRDQAEGYTVFSIPVGVVYRPNEAKVKNLKTKDYLGKARLIATATTNISTGFTAAEERQQQVLEATPRDDRLPENISYAATNLVQRNLSSRYAAREQSAPPSMNRNMFPPTPPPEAEKPARTSAGQVSSHPSRSTSISNEYPIRPRAYPAQSPEQRPSAISRSQTYGPPTLNQGNVRPSGTPESQQGWQRSLNEVPRRGTARTASESRVAPPRRLFHERTNSARAPPPAPLFKETTPRMQESNVPQEATVDDVYSMYSKRPSQSRRGLQTLEEQQFLEEHEEYIDESPDDNSKYSSPPRIVHKREYSSGLKAPSRSAARNTEKQTINVKVHIGEKPKAKLMEIEVEQHEKPLLTFGDFESKIRGRFNIRDPIKIEMQDLHDSRPGSRIDLEDQQDLDILLAHAQRVARRDREDFLKLEIWIQAI